jgi:hypothetical protein
VGNKDGVALRCRTTDSGWVLEVSTQEALRGIHNVMRVTFSTDRQSVVSYICMRGLFTAFTRGGAPVPGLALSSLLREAVEGEKDESRPHWSRGPLRAAAPRPR